MDRLRDDGCRNRAVFAPDAFPLPVAAEFDLRTVGVDHLVLFARVFLLLDGICHREILEMRGEELLRACGSLSTLVGFSRPSAYAAPNIVVIRNRVKNVFFIVLSVY